MGDTAQAERDFVSTVGTLSFAAGQMSQSLVIPLIPQAQQGLGDFMVQLANPTGTSMIGSPGTATIFILNDVVSDFSLSNFAVVNPAPAPAAGGTIAITLSPADADKQWRIFGELDWRNSGTTAAGLTPGNYIVEFKPATSYVTPANLLVPLGSGAPYASTVVYAPNGSPTPGSLSVVLERSAPARGGCKGTRTTWPAARRNRTSTPAVISSNSSPWRAGSPPRTGKCSSRAGCSPPPRPRISSATRRRARRRSSPGR